MSPLRKPPETSAIVYMKIDPTKTFNPLPEAFDLYDQSPPARACPKRGSAAPCFFDNMPGGIQVVSTSNFMELDS